MAGMCDPRGRRSIQLGALGLLVLALLSPPATRAAFECAVTLPNHDPFPPGGGFFSGYPAGELPPTHGNGQLWTVLDPKGTVRATRPDAIAPDGSVVLKFPWARRIVETAMVDGALTGIFAGDLEIEVRRLDAPAPPATVTMNPQGVHVGSLIRFPTPGCWEVTGRAGTDSLSFVFLLTIDGQPVPNTATAQPQPPMQLLGVLVLAAAAALGTRRRAASN